MKAKIKSKLNLENRVNLQDVLPLDVPFLLYIDPSSLCNLKCEFCPMGHSALVKKLNYKRQIMSFDLFRKVIDDLQEFRAPLKVLRMNKVGEPLMNKKIDKMISYAKKSNRVNYIDFATNACLLTKDLSSRLVESGLDRLNISIEGVKSEDYLSYCHAKVDFESIIKNIKFLYDNKKNTEITIKIPSNYITKEDEIKFMHIFGDYCDRIFVENITSIWPNFNINETSRILSIEEKSQYGRSVKDRSICTYIFYSMVINASGTVSACCPDWEEKLIIGDIRHQSLNEIWKGEKLRALQLSHLKGYRKENKICENCGHIKYCQVDDIDEFSTLLLDRYKE